MKLYVVQYLDSHQVTITLYCDTYTFSSSKLMTCKKTNLYNLSHVQTEEVISALLPVDLTKQSQCEAGRVSKLCYNVILALLFIEDSSSQNLFSLCKPKGDKHMNTHKNMNQTYNIFYAQTQTTYYICYLGKYRCATDFLSCFHLSVR